MKKTVNFDAPEVYHLYYGDEVGTPRSVMTYFLFRQMPRGRRGVSEVGITEFAVNKGTLGHWEDDLAKKRCDRPEPGGHLWRGTVEL